MVCLSVHSLPSACLSRESSAMRLATRLLSVDRCRLFPSLILTARLRQDSKRATESSPPKIMDSILRSLILACTLVGVSTYYRTTPPPSLPLFAFTLALLWIPTFACLAIIAPSFARLERLPDDSWRPRGLDTAHAIVLIALMWAISRDMDIAVDVGGGLARDFEIFRDLESEREFNFREAATAILLSVGALEAGKRLSLKTVPLFEGCKMLKWDTGVVEETEEAELELDEWSGKRPEWEKGFW